MTISFENKPKKNDIPSIATGKNPLGPREYPKRLVTSSKRGFRARCPKKKVYCNPFYTGAGAVAVPGEVKGYFEAKKRFGNSSIPMTRLVQPIIKMCKEGIRTTRSLATAVKKSIKHIKSDPLMRYIVPFCLATMGF